MGGPGKEDSAALLEALAVWCSRRQQYFHQAGAAATEFYLLSFRHPCFLFHKEATIVPPAHHSATRVWDYSAPGCVDLCGGAIKEDRDVEVGERQLGSDSSLVLRELHTINQLR
ncbi:uncharacterized protein LOC120435678 isoform X3 [Oreochromis aureus]|uniref:uncharacterized protein LOC120435678 isoform X3 n=1 Tax=Oreochromis aureus TaxID=47969 RepID=UPI001954F034|nr:uncharacterized protein LOC120435678 isoform X3 [Oreochromis aureus]